MIDRLPTLSDCHSMTKDSETILRPSENGTIVGFQEWKKKLIHNFSVWIGVVTITIHVVGLNDLIVS